ncbi:hypothetical protein [Massilia sp. BHUDP2]|uniref:hypothetical protein n=1 Tax=Massilia sp. BHUDP2 TaxID=3034505 RepID=UPI0039063487
MNYLIRHCVQENKAAFRVLHPDGSTDAAGVPRKVTAYHKVEMRGHPSLDLIQSINGGVLESIELIDKRKRNLNWDTNGNTKEIRRTVMLRVGPKANAKNMSRIREAATLAVARHYGEARVKFKGPNGVPGTVTLETDTMQLAQDSLYVKKEKISGFSSLLESSSQRLNQEIVGKMARLL